MTTEATAIKDAIKTYFEKIYAFTIPPMKNCRAIMRLKICFVNRIEDYFKNIIKFVTHLPMNKL
jgi:CBS domain containing-hemolysin-like protein